MKNNRTGEIDRRKILALGSIVGLAAWHEPLLKAVVLPSHAQTSGACPEVNDLSIIGFWRFTDQNNVQIDIEFFDDLSITVNGSDSPDSYVRTPDGTIVLDIAGFGSWQGTITHVNNCNAEEITITVAPTNDNSYAPPLVGLLL